MRTFTTAAAVLATMVLGAASASAAQLRGYWTFDNLGALGADSGPLGADPTHTLNPQDNATQNPAGRFGGALQLDGTNDALVQPALGFPAGLPTGNATYTIAAWIKPTAGVGDRGMVGWGGYGTTNQVNAFRMFGTNGFRAYWWGNDQDVTTVAPANLTDGNWHHAVTTFDGSTRKIFLDGVQLTTTGGNATGHNTTAANFRIGSTNNGEYWNGLLDDVGIWDGALTQAEINALQTSAIPEPAGMALVAVGAVGMFGRRRRR